MQDELDRQRTTLSCPASGIFVANPEPRVPCVLLLDTSVSMGGQPISELNAGVMLYKDELAAHELAAKRVELAIVTFGGSPQLACDFTTVAGFHPPVLTAAGDTPMGAAIRQGLEMVQARKELYKRNGILSYRPWIFLITDGGPTDEWRSAAEQVRQTEESKAAAFYAVGVEGANMEILKQICIPDRQPLKLKGLRFRDLFKWLSDSHNRISQSRPGESVPLDNPTAGPKGWGTT